MENIVKVHVIAVNKIPMHICPSAWSGNITQYLCSVHNVFYVIASS